MEKIKYLNNKDFILELQRSKATYSYFISPEYAMYDVILPSLDLLTPQLLQDSIILKAKRLSSKLAVVDPETIDSESIVFRVMTDSHIPPEPDITVRLRKKSSVAGEFIKKTNFPPFKHYIMRENEIVEVGRSHWKDGLQNGTFCIDHGHMTNKLAKMFMLLTENISHKNNWRNYSWKEDFIGSAITHLCQVGLQFDESRSSNPFAFFTTIISHCLSGETEILTKEYGSICIKDVSEKDVHLLDGNGDWVLCHVYDHGIQETQLNYFQGGNKKIEIWSTPEHGWVSNGKIIKTKDFLRHNTKIDDLRPSKKIINNENYRRGVIHGLVYGDGTKSSVKTGYIFRLCSHEESITPYLEGYNSFKCLQTGYPIYYIGKAWTNLKKFPDNPGEDLDYLLGFIRGWFAADGCVSKKSYPTLCGDISEYEWLKKWGPLVGWHLNSFTKLNQITNYGLRNKISLNFHIRTSSMTLEDFIIIQHRTRWLTKTISRTTTRKYNWDTIKSWISNGLTTKDIAEKLNVSVTAFRSSFSQHKKIEKKNKNEHSWYVYGSKQPNETRMERVYCPVVPTTHTYALSCGIHQSNCFVRVLNLEKRGQDIKNDLLIMAGVQPSFSRQIDNEIEQRADESEKIEKIPAKRGRKPKSQQITHNDE